MEPEGPTNLVAVIGVVILKKRVGGEAGPAAEADPSEGIVATTKAPLWSA